MGKSAFALNLLLRLGLPSVLYSLDTDLSTQGSRAVSAITGLSEHRIREDPRGWTRVLDRKAPWLRAYEDLGLRTKELVQLIKAEEELWGRVPAAFVMDNVQDLAGGTSYEQYSDCFVELHQVAQRTKTVVVALNHVKIAAAERRVTLHDSLYAGQNKAALVLGLTRESSGLWCSVLKNRFGQADSQGNYGVMMRFDPTTSMRIE